MARKSPREIVHLWFLSVLSASIIEHKKWGVGGGGWRQCNKPSVFTVRLTIPIFQVYEAYSCGETNCIQGPCSADIFLHWHFIFSSKAVTGSTMPQLVKMRPRHMGLAKDLYAREHWREKAGGKQISSVTKELKSMPKGWGQWGSVLEHVNWIAGVWP